MDTITETITAKRFTVTSEAQQLSLVNEVINRERVYIRNLSGVTVFIGGMSVTPETGFPIFSKEMKDFPLKNNVQLYAVAFSDAEIAVMQTR